jgi:hypothetical protein
MLQDAPHITDEAIRLTLQRCPSLQTLHLQGCVRLSGNCFLSLIAHSRGLSLDTANLKSLEPTGVHHPLFLSGAQHDSSSRPVGARNGGFDAAENPNLPSKRARVHATDPTLAALSTLRRLSLSSSVRMTPRGLVAAAHCAPELEEMVGVLTCE